MAKAWVALVLLITLFGPVAFAQPIYEWTDEKGQRHFSNFPPTGVTAKKRSEGIGASESVPTAPDLEPNVLPPSGDKTEHKPVAKLPDAEPPAAPERRWLLVSPPRRWAKVEQGGPFSEWIPRESFDSDEACTRGRAIWIDNSWASTPDRVAWIDPQAANSVCIPASRFVTGKESDVVIVAQRFEIATAGFSSVLLKGRVFNRGQATARNVVATYRIRSALGSALVQGSVATSPDEIPGLAFGEFRTPSIAGWSADELVEQVEVDWVRK